MEMSFRADGAVPYMMPGTSKTFREAADSYISYGGDNRYMPRIVEHLGDRPLHLIYPFDVQQMANELYPKHSNNTKNRQALTPVRATMNHAYDRGWGPLIKLKAFKVDEPKRKKAASPAWIHAFTRQCDKDGLDHMAGLVFFMSQTGARVSEAVALRWAQVDLIGRTALLLKTKTERNSVRFLTDQLISRMYRLQAGRGPDDRVFRYRCRHSVNERIAAVCARAAITYKPTHTCGRHAFANNAMDLGLDVKSTMDAGGWKSPTVFLGTYVNPRNAGRAVAERFNVYQYENEL